MPMLPCLLVGLVLLSAVAIKDAQSQESSCFEEEKAKADFNETVVACKEELKMPPGPPKRFRPKDMMNVGKCVLKKKGGLNADGKPDKSKVKELITPYIKTEYQAALLKTYDECMPEDCTEESAKKAMGCIMIDYKNWGCAPAPGFKMPGFPGK